MQTLLWVNYINSQQISCKVLLHMSYLKLVFFSFWNINIYHMGYPTFCLLFANYLTKIGIGLLIGLVKSKVQGNVSDLILLLLIIKVINNLLLFIYFSFLINPCNFHFVCLEHRI